jgi:FMN-dependent NADH-azoreductase
VGRAGAKRVVIASSPGGIYPANETLQALDHQETYLRTVLNFLGITDVRIVRGEGLQLSEETDQGRHAGTGRDRQLGTAGGDLRKEQQTLECGRTA